MVTKTASFVAVHQPSDDEEEGDEEDGDEESQEEGEQEGGEAADGNGEAPSAEATTDEDITENANKPAEEPVAGGSSSAAASTSAAAEPSAGPSSGEPSTSNGITAADYEEEAEDAEATSAEVAWEVLSLARDVFRRQLFKGDELKLKLAEALQKLGEISIEWENYAAAIDILGESLSLRKEALPDDDRLIAETYYHIGVSFSFSNEFDRANDCYRSAVDVIERRIQNLKKFVAENKEYSQEKSQKELEIIELESLLPEMQAKIEDSRDQMVNLMTAVEKEQSEEIKEKEVSAKLSDTAAKPVNDITHLVKRKVVAVDGLVSPSLISFCCYSAPVPEASHLRKSRRWLARPAVATSPVLPKQYPKLYHNLLPAPYFGTSTLQALL